MGKIKSLLLTLILGFGLLGSLGSVSTTVKAESKLLEVPSGFTIDIYNEKDVILLWEEPTDGRITDFAILRSDEAGKSPVEVARVQATTQTYIDETVEIGKTYIYRIQSIGAGYTAAETEPKSILVSKIENTIVTTPDPQAASAVDNLAKDTIGKVVGDQDPDKFLPMLIGANLLIIGISLIIYLTFRMLIEKRMLKQLPNTVPAEIRTIPEKPVETVKKVSNKSVEAEIKGKERGLTGVELKTGHQDKNIVQLAKSRFLKREKKNIKDWQLAD